MDDIKDILESRAESLGKNTLDVMTEVKLAILKIVKVEVRVLSVQNGTVKIATEDAPAASEIRLHKIQIINQINKKLAHQPIKSLNVVIR